MVTLILIIFPCLDKWHRAKRFVPYQGYQQGYVVQEEQMTDYPEHQPIGGSTRAYNPPHQMTAKIQPNPVWPTPGQPNPVISCSQMRNNRRKRQRATQGAVTYPVQRAAPPGQRWILVPANPAVTRHPRQGVWRTTVLRVHQNHSPHNQGQNQRLRQTTVRTMMTHPSCR